MSENLTETFYPNHQKFNNATSSATSVGETKEQQDEANKLFDLISQLNNDNLKQSQHKIVITNNKNYSQENSPDLNMNFNTNSNDEDKYDSINESFINPLKVVDNDKLKNETSILSNDSILLTTSSSSTTNEDNHMSSNVSMNELKNSLNKLSISTGNENRMPAANKNVSTKIPRIPNLKPSAAFPIPSPAVTQSIQAAITPVSNSTNSSHSISALSANEADYSSPSETPISIVETKPLRASGIPTHRAARSTYKSSSINSAVQQSTTCNLEKNGFKVSGESLNLVKPISNKRGMSLSSNSVNKSNRSMSINGDESFNEPEFNLDGTKNVRYVVRHKPKESKVKIFSQKVTIKNVSSKINSLEKANYVPGGGNVVIETKPLNWNAQSKIGSLDYANYQPNGGNVKIESHKLNWSAQSKIRSLEYANYQPKGGNIKIESHKLNFKEKARPKTDTGLIIIETISPKTNLSSNSNSQSNSNDNLSQYRRQSFEAN